MHKKITKYFSNKEITESQKKYIQFLLDQCGFKGVPLRNDYLKLLLNGCYSANSASIIIDDLIHEKEIRQNPKLISPNKEYLAISDLAEYAFCPSSFSIKKTYELPKTEKMINGVNLHANRFLETFLSNIYAKRERTFSESGYKDKEYYINRGSYGDLLKSQIIFRGHGENVNPFINPKGNLAGIPDYIFKLEDNTKFVVEEKHTWQETVNKPWISHKVQVLGYIFGLKSLELNHGYIIYFSWYPGREFRTHNARLYVIHQSASNKKLITDIYNKTKNLIENGKELFDINSINLNRCINCSARFLCDHRTGKYKEIKYPYNYN